MELDITKLENVKELPGKTIARCPACAEIEQDKKGEHLFIGDEDRFGCVIYPGEAGREHRQRIIALAGIRTTGTYIDVQWADTRQSNIIIPDVLGRLGRLKLTSFEKIENNILDSIQKDYSNDVPSVPDQHTETIIINRGDI